MCSNGSDKTIDYWGVYLQQANPKKISPNRNKPHCMQPALAPAAHSEEEFVLSIDNNKRAAVVQGGSFDCLLRWTVLEQHERSHARAFLYAYRTHVAVTFLRKSLMTLNQQERAHSTTEHSAFTSSYSTGCKCATTSTLPANLQ